MSSHIHIFLTLHPMRILTPEGISIEKTRRITQLEGRCPGISLADQIPTTITSNFSRKTHEIMVSLSLRPGNHSVISCMC